MNVKRNTEEPVETIQISTHAGASKEEYVKRIDRISEVEIRERAQLTNEEC